MPRLINRAGVVVRVAEETIGNLVGEWSRVAAGGADHLGDEGVEHGYPGGGEVDGIVAAEDVRPSSDGAKTRSRLK